ncbi:hypothetical protein MAPG_04670 [Magnaporthiopsis poae ATCC 64411]|uniref:Protein kinase domain-containing protein n=1 Tax=Magnaporthiopsis poae (strain ATCC 64411 / 73-15) TaxID=644358 RepID=A0A0C4DXC7_MAGP6|nr:hypothetical protein MAPG_04670 [Magnaporthiopsis poae ATCC 64411]
MSYKSPPSRQPLITVLDGPTFFSTTDAGYSETLNKRGGASRSRSSDQPSRVQLARRPQEVLEAIRCALEKIHSYIAGTALHATCMSRDTVPALSWVHGLGVIHNDIKLGDVVHVDFGLSTENPSDWQALWVLSHERELKVTKKLAASIRLWNHRFDARSE